MMPLIIGSIVLLAWLVLYLRLASQLLKDTRWPGGLLKAAVLSLFATTLYYLALTLSMYLYSTAWEDYQGYRWFFSTTGWPYALPYLNYFGGLEILGVRLEHYICTF